MKSSVGKERKCNREVMKEHLSILATKDPESREWMVTIQTFAAKGHERGVIPQVMHLPVNDSSIEKLALLSEKGATIAVVPQRTDFKGRRKENILAVRYLAVDIDVQTDLDKLLKLPVAPNIIVETSPAKFHVYFRTKCEPAVYRKRAHKLAEFLDADSAATDVARALRVAGTINWKGEKPFVSRLHMCERNDKPLAASVLLKRMGCGSKIEVQKPSTITPVCVTAPGPELSNEQVEELLSHIPSDDRLVWLHVGMALHSWDLGRGFALWDSWSRKSRKYEEADQRKTWKGFNPSGGRTICSLNYYANKAKSGNPSSDANTWLPTTECDIAEYAAVALSSTLRIVDEDQYYVFDGHRWRCNKKAATRLLASVTDELTAIAKEGGSAHAEKALQQYKSYLKAQRLLPYLNKFRELDATVEDFDQEAELLGVANGVVNLRSGGFRAGQPEDMLTITAAASYDKDAKCPRFMQFLKEIAPGDEYRKYLQTLAGYLLVGDAREQKCYVLIGKGGNGKGTLTRLIESVMGATYCATLPPSFLKNASNGSANGPTPALMALVSARAVFCTESEHKGGIDQVFFKQLTGNDRLSGRANYGDQQSFYTAAKLLLSTNELPDWAYTNDAIWRRIVVLPFMAKFTGDKRDNDLDAKLRKEVSGVLNWMIEGAVRYLKDGSLDECAEVQKATKEARKQSDTVRLWIETGCKKSPDSHIGADEAYNSYRAFAGCNQLHALGVRQFKSHMLTLGYEHARRSRGNIYKGLCRSSE